MIRYAQPTKARLSARVVSFEQTAAHAACAASSASRGSPRIDHEIRYAFGQRARTRFSNDASRPSDAAAARSQSLETSSTIAKTLAEGEVFAAHGNSERACDTMFHVRSVIRRLGNSQGVSIPKSLLEEAGLSIDAPIEMSVDGNSIVLRRLDVHPRTGWAEDAATLIDGEEDREWLEADLDRRSRAELT